MKKQLIILFLAISFSTTAQPILWGTMQIGGTNGLGMIYHINGDGTGFTPAPGFTGGSPQGDLLPYNGFLYGLTTSGGIYYNGDVFKYNAATGIYTTLFSFSDTASGKYPRASLLLASDGKMYGVAAGGGSIDYGTLFSFNPVNNQFSKIVDFTGPNGQYPSENIVEYNGKLYGTSSSGGAGNYGEIFSYDLTSGNLTVAHSFNFTDGMAPYGSLLLWNSLLYGMAFVGGSTGSGTIFSFDPSNPGSVITLHNFNGTDGGAPMGSLMYAGNSVMYGVTAQGGVTNDGVIFSFNPSGNIYTKLHDFNTTNGRDPEGTLMQASDGNLYGTTAGGGTGSFGTLFKYNIGGSQFTKIYDCALNTGCTPNASFIEYNGPTGLPDLTKNNELKILNNPVDDQLDLVLKGYDEAFSIQVFSADGKVIMDWADVLIHDEHSIGVSKLPAGNYFIYVASGKHEFVSQFMKK